MAPWFVLGYPRAAHLHLSVFRQLMCLLNAPIIKRRTTHDLTNLVASPHD
jgi:hypothetical protein